MTSHAKPSIDPRVHAHVRAALDEIQAAQNCLGRAARLLSPIVGLCPDHQRVSREYDRVHALWYKLEHRRAKLTAKHQLDGCHQTSSYPCKPCDAVTLSEAPVAVVPHATAER